MKRVYWGMMIGLLLVIGRNSCVWGKLPATITRFNTQFEHCLQRETEKERAIEWSQLWDIMDELIIESLNTGRDFQSIHHLLTQLAGYKAPQAIQSETIGNAVFSMGAEQPSPNYALHQLVIDDTLYYIGAYNDRDYDIVASLVNRLSVYGKYHGQWVKTDTYEGAKTLLVYLVPALLQHHVCITLEEWIGGDHIGGM